MDKELVRSVLKDNFGNIARTARSLGLDYKDVNDEFGIKLEAIIRPKGPVPDDFQSLGKKGMKHFVVAVKANGGTWPLQFYNKIQDARKKYDNGTHEMCQGKRKDGWVILYLIPRVEVRAPKERYFQFPWGNEA